MGTPQKTGIRKDLTIKWLEEYCIMMLIEAVGHGFRGAGRLGMLLVWARAATYHGRNSPFWISMLLFLSFRAGDIGLQLVFCSAHYR